MPAKQQYAGNTKSWWDVYLDECTVRSGADEAPDLLHLILKKKDMCGRTV